MPIRPNQGLSANRGLAVGRRLKLADLASAVVPYPTLSELSKRAAGSFYTPTLFGPRTRALVRWLLKLP